MSISTASSQLEEGIIFIGSGCSTGLPQLNHIFTKNITNDEEQPCLTCLNALNDPTNKNNRNNVSLLIRIQNKNILIDCGKTFREAALKSFTALNINRIEAILLTHCHEDAVGGLDEVRCLQEWLHPSTSCTSSPPHLDNAVVTSTPPIAVNDETSPSSCISSSKHESNPVQHSFNANYICLRPMPVYLSLHTYDTLKRRFGYIVEAANRREHTRKVSVLDFNFLNDAIELNEIEDCILKRCPLDVNGFSTIEFEFLNDHSFKITAFPVYHGGSYKSMGFAFGWPHTVVYISDVSSIPLKVENYLKTLNIKVLIMDALRPRFTDYGHFCLEDGLEWVKKLEPRSVYFVGMHCSLEHYSSCEYLSIWLEQQKNEKKMHSTDSIELAYDGLMIPLTLTNGK